MKDRISDQRGGSEWEPVKILLEGDDFSDKMNTTYPTPYRLKQPKLAKVM
jgi:hypothetical protein